MRWSEIIRSLVRIEFCVQKVPARIQVAGSSLNQVLKTAIIVGLCGVAVPMALCAVADHALITDCGVFFQVQRAPLNSITQILGGPRAAGKWMGLQNLCANLAGVLAPLVTGFIVYAAVTLPLPWQKEYITQDARLRPHDSMRRLQDARVSCVLA